MLPVDGWLLVYLLVLFLVLVVVYCVDSFFCGIVYYTVVGLVCCVGLVGFCLVVCVVV